MKKLLLTLAVVFTACLGGCSTATVEPASPEDQFVVGMECAYAPFNWTESKKTETNYPIDGTKLYAEGYDVQIAKKIADGLNQELVIMKLDWDALQPALSTNTIDAIIAGMTATPERAENAEFTTPYYQSEMVMIVLKNSELANATSINDFSGHKVLGQLNTMYDTVIDQIPNVQHLTPLESYPYMIASLLNGEAEALTAETPVGQGAIAAHPELALVTFAEGQGFNIDMSETSVSIGVKKGNIDLLNQVQAILDTISESERTQMMKDATSRQPSNN